MQPTDIFNKKKGGKSGGLGNAEQPHEDSFGYQGQKKGPLVLVFSFETIAREHVQERESTSKQTI